MEVFIEAKLKFSIENNSIEIQGRELKNITK